MITTLITVILIAVAVWVLAAVATAIWFVRELNKMQKDNEKISEGFKVLR